MLMLDELEHLRSILGIRFQRLTVFYDLAVSLPLHKASSEKFFEVDDATGSTISRWGRNYGNNNSETQLLLPKIYRFSPWALTFVIVNSILSRSTCQKIKCYFLRYFIFPKFLKLFGLLKNYNLQYNAVFSGCMTNLSTLIKCHLYFKF